MEIFIYLIVIECPLNGHNMAINYHKMAISHDTYNMVMVECVKEFQISNPHLIGIKITQDFIVQRIARWYLGENHPINRELVK